MEARLRPVNGILTLLARWNLNPAVLADAGFRVAGLEVPATTMVGGVVYKVVIDVVLFQEETNHLILCEAKSGANVEEDQAHSYRALAPNAAVQAAYITLRSRTPPTSETLYVCLDEHVDRIRLGLQQAECRFPVLSVGERRIELVDHEFATNLLAQPLRGAVELGAPPIRLLPFDPDSPVEVIEPFVKAQMVALLSQKREYISLTGLTEAVAGHYGLYADKAQQELKKKISKAVDRIVRASPDRFSHHKKTGTRPEALVRFLKTPEDLDPRGRTQAYQALGRSGRPSRPTSHADPNQLDLLQELDAGDNDDEDDSDLPGEEGNRDQSRDDGI